MNPKHTTNYFPSQPYLTRESQLERRLLISNTALETLVLTDRLPQGVIDTLNMVIKGNKEVLGK